MLTMLDLFAGIGGATLAGDRLGIQTTQLVENNPDAQLILRSHYPSIPIHPDIRDYHPKRGEFDIIWNSFPCTGTSNAGKREGLSHPESALWREGIRCLIEGQPKFFIVEQPEGVIRRGLRAILGAISMAGYAYEIELVTAAKLGAGHRRPRVFIISYPDKLRGCYQQTGWSDQMRELVEITKHHSQWATVERRGFCYHPRFPAGVVQPFVPTNTPGRIRSRYLAGRTVTPGQAAIALRRVLYLDSRTETPNTESL